MDSLKQITELRKKLKRQIECSVRGELTGLTEVMKKAKSSLKELDLLLSQDILKRGKKLFYPILNLTETLMIIPFLLF